MSQLTEKELSLMTAMVKNFNGSLLASVSKLLAQPTLLPSSSVYPEARLNPRSPSLTYEKYDR